MHAGKYENETGENETGVMAGDKVVKIDIISTIIYKDYKLFSTWDKDPIH